VLLQVEGLQAQYVDAQGRVVRAVQGVDFAVREGSLFTLLGPSGCGKTTTMRCIAGLERPVAGRISIAAEIVSCSQRGVFVAANRRNIGMVFQSYAIWPHLSVFENAAFPLRVSRARHAARKIQDKVMHVLGVVGLEEYAQRDATALSGGQQQRLALARALAMEPRLLLLDEPLSNLDAKLRERMRFELQRLQRELGLTTVYVTHDQSEALALSHEIAVMRDGRIEQVAPPREIYERPANRFVADFVGSTNFVDAVALGPSGLHRCRLGTPIGELEVQVPRTLHAGESMLLSIRPEDIEPATGADDGFTTLSGVVVQKVFLGERLDLQLRIGERQLLMRAHPSFAVEVGQSLRVRVRSAQCIDVPAGA
jgi:iron(III) transport system ATP-binding protein